MTQLGVTGKERDGESTLDYFGARYLSSVQGRFTSTDPGLEIQLRGSSGAQAILNPQEWNRYQYGAASPTKNVDPDGRQQLDANLKNLLETLKAERTLKGAARGGLIQSVLQTGLNEVLGRLFGFLPNAYKGGLKMHEYRLLQRVSSYRHGSKMIGAGMPNQPGIDAVDIDRARGVSLKQVSGNVTDIVDSVAAAVKSIAKTGFTDVEIYVDASGATKEQLSGNAAIQELLQNPAITSVTVFTKDGGVVEFRKP